MQAQCSAMTMQTQYTCPILRMPPGLLVSSSLLACLPVTACHAYRRQPLVLQTMAGFVHDNDSAESVHMSCICLLVPSSLLACLPLIMTN